MLLMIRFYFRASNGNRLSVDSCPVDGGILDKPRCVVPSVRQVHPICEEKAHHMIQAYDKHSIEPPAYPLQPNICVEGGRIEFIKLSPDGSTGGSYHVDVVDSAPLPPITPPPPPAPLTTIAPIRPPAKITVTRAQQTSDDDEKYDVAKVGGSSVTTKSDIKTLLNLLQSCNKKLTKKNILWDEN